MMHASYTHLIPLSTSSATHLMRSSIARSGSFSTPRNYPSPRPSMAEESGLTRQLYCLIVVSRIVREIGLAASAVSLLSTM